MKANEALSKIAVVTDAGLNRSSLDWVRQGSQFGMIVLLLLIPLTGIFRIDVSSGFVVLGRQVWFADFSLVFGLWLALACTFIMLYSTVGTAFCGWLCPQNTFSSLADKFTFKLLGKRAVIDWESQTKTKVAGHKNKAINWFLLGTKLLGLSFVAALVPLLYFIEPGQLWGLISFQDQSETAFSLRWIYMVFAFIVFVNLAVVRHFLCRYMCIYRIWQFLFKTKDTLHIHYDSARSSECEKCSYCVSKCMVQIDPRNTTTFDSCTNCGACVTACDTMHTKENKKGLLSFKMGDRETLSESHRQMRPLPSAKQRLMWVLPVWFIGMGIFVYGLFTYDAHNLAVYQSEVHQGKQITEYRINIANKLFEPSTVTLTIEGLREGDYTLSEQSMNFDTVGRKDLFLHLSAGLAPGVYSFIVRAESDDGWKNFVRLNHVVTRG